MGIAALFGGYFYLRRNPWSRKFLISMNAIVIAYSVIAESLAEIYGWLPRGIGDAFIGALVAIAVSAAVISMLL
jgi:hypothetical protein